MTSYPITKSMRWRMKDWVSCFNTCRLPIVDEESEAGMEISPPFPPTTSFGHQYSKGDDRRRRQDSDRHSIIEFPCNEGIKEAGNKVSPIERGLTKISSNSSQMSEEEYIVFCFRENGDIHVIEDNRKSSATSDQKQSKSINRKLMYADNLEANKGIINVQVVSRFKEDKKQEMHEDGVHISGEKAKKEGKNHWGSGDERLMDEIKEMAYRHVEESTIESKREGASHESSSSSNLESEESTASFSFPVLIDSRRSWEWMGSPVLMPRPEDVATPFSNLKDNRGRLHF